MVFPKEPKFMQMAEMALHIIVLIIGMAATLVDRRWNHYTSNTHRLALLHKEYGLLEPFNFEETILIERALTREVDTQTAALVLIGLTLLVSTLHLYLCFILNYLFYRKLVNIYLHMGFSVVIFISGLAYLSSFVATNNSYDAHFHIIYEDIPEDEIPRNPCHFPQPEIVIFQTLTNRPEACHDGYAKLIVTIICFLNSFLHICTACVIGCFVEEEDAEEMFYRELDVMGGGALPPLSTLPPLPYYCRPLAESPTSKKHLFKTAPKTKINRVEVPENWTDPRADLSQPPEPETTETDPVIPPQPEPTIQQDVGEAKVQNEKDKGQRKRNKDV